LWTSGSLRHSIEGGLFDIAAGASFEITASTDFSGTISGTGDGNFDITVGTHYIDAAGATIDTPEGMFRIYGGTYEGPGALTVASGSTLDFVSSNRILNTTLAVDGSINHIAGVLTINATGAVHISSGGLYELTGTGIISGTSGNIDNEGTFRRDGSGSVTVGLNFDNTGTVEVASGTLSFTSVVNQFSSNTLSDGTWIVSGTLGLPGSANVTTIGSAATVILDGATSSFPELSPLATVQGTFEVIGGRSYTSTASIVNSGTVEVGLGSKITTASTYSQSAGNTILTGGTIVANASLTGGTLTGAGTISGNLTNAATVTPGSSPGIIYISGNYEQTSAGILNVEIQGTNAVTPDFDQLIISGSAKLDGTLNVTFINNFVADKTESFRILTYASRSGDFSTFNFPIINGRTMLAQDPQATFYDLLGNTLIVRNTGDSGPFSLRDRISTSNAGSDEDTIFLQSDRRGTVHHRSDVGFAGDYTETNDRRHERARLFRHADCRNSRRFGRFGGGVGTPRGQQQHDPRVDCQSILQLRHRRRRAGSGDEQPDRRQLGRFGDGRRDGGGQRWIRRQCRQRDEHDYWRHHGC
jgi:hypothetical protein